MLYAWRARHAASISNPDFHIIESAPERFEEAPFLPGVKEKQMLADQDESAIGSTAQDLGCTASQVELTDG